MLTDQPFVSVVIVTINRYELLLRCIDSVLLSNYKNFEVIVVDNNSSDNTPELIKKKYGSKIYLIGSKENLFAGGGRNLGATYARGDLLLFIDDDNVVDKNMISNLVNFMIHNPQAGIVGPKMYYQEDPLRIWYAGAVISLTTSKTKYVGINEIDKGQFNDDQETGHVPNVIMARKKPFAETDGFDTVHFPMHYEESDLAERIRKKGYQVYVVTSAITYHDTPVKTNNTKNKGLALNDEKRAYFNSKNRILFMKKYGMNYLLFVIIYLPIFIMLYIFLLVRVNQLRLIKPYLKGLVDGLFTKI